MVRHGIVEELVSRRKLTNQCYLLAQARPMTLKHLLVKEFYVSRRKVTQTAKVKEPGNEFHACIQRRGMVWLLGCVQLTFVLDLKQLS